MPIVRPLILGLLAMGAIPVLAGDYSLLVAPTADLTYRGEGKLLPDQEYVNRFEGNRAPLYRFEWRQTPRSDGYWGIGLWHTGMSVGGTYNQETISNISSGTYQTASLNVGFTNFFVTYHQPLAHSPVSAQVHLSIAREIFKRKSFNVNGVSGGGLDDVNEISAEGLGFGLEGCHGRTLYARWQTAAHYYVQLFDAKTDASAGSIFQAEGGLGWRLTKSLSIELGGVWQDWFILGQGNRRLHLEGTDGAIISYNRNQTRLGGFFFRLETRL